MQRLPELVYSQKMLIRVTVNKTLIAYKGDVNYTLARGSQARVKVHPLVSKADQMIA